MWDGQGDGQRNFAKNFDCSHPDPYIAYSSTDLAHFLVMQRPP